MTPNLTDLINLIHPSNFSNHLVSKQNFFPINQIILIVWILLMNHRLQHHHSKDYQFHHLCVSIFSILVFLFQVLKLLWEFKIIALITINTCFGKSAITIAIFIINTIATRLDSSPKNKQGPSHFMNIIEAIAMLIIIIRITNFIVAINIRTTVMQVIMVRIIKALKRIILFINFNSLIFVCGKLHFHNHHRGIFPFAVSYSNQPISFRISIHFIYQVLHLNRHLESP